MHASRDEAGSGPAPARPIQCINRPLLAAIIAAVLCGCAETRLSIADRAEIATALEVLPVDSDTIMLVGAGDIAMCDDLEPAMATALLLDVVIEASPEAYVFTVGDHAYPDGTTEEFERCYGATWGRFNARTLPSPGNHDYETEQGAPYFAYFEHYASNPSAREAGYYSLDLGSWHIISLNSNLPMDEESQQLAWLEADLRANRRSCILALWHHPLFSSGFHGLQPLDPGRGTIRFWTLLAMFGADLIVNGHAHMYERFLPQTPSGQPAASGIAQIVVGTGGAERDLIVYRRANSAYVANDVYGVLILLLHSGGYDWAFLGIDGVILDHSTQRVPC